MEVRPDSFDQFSSVFYFDLFRPDVFRPVFFDLFRGIRLNVCNTLSLQKMIFGSEVVGEKEDIFRSKKIYGWLEWV